MPGGRYHNRKNNRSSKAAVTKKEEHKYNRYPFIIEEDDTDG
jgi:hypothetical protein